MARKGHAIEMDVGPDANWQAKSDLQTLLEAHKVKKDKKRHAAAQAEAKRQLASMQHVAGADDDDGDEDAAGN